jgi:hypothetical protein
VRVEPRAQALPVAGIATEGPDAELAGIPVRQHREVRGVGREIGQHRGLAVGRDLGREEEQVAARIPSPQPVVEPCSLGQHKKGRIGWEERFQTSEGLRDAFSPQARGRAGGQDLVGSSPDRELLRREARGRLSETRDERRRDGRGRRTGY